MSRVTFAISVGPRFGPHEEEEQVPMRIAAYAIFLSVLAACFLASILSSLKGVLLTAAGLSIFALPGLFAGLSLFGRRAYRCPESLIFGSALGIGLSSTAAVAVGYLAGWSPSPILMAIAVLSALCALLGKAYWNRPLLPPPRRWESWEYLLLAGVMLVLTGFVAMPFMNVGRITAYGYAYTWLFGYDFLLRADYTSAMTIGFPPNSLSLAGEPLRMYLVGYALPAFIYSASDKGVPLHAVMQLTSLGLNSILYCCLYAFLRVFFSSKRVLISTAFVSLFGYSYYWLVSLAKRIVLNPTHPPELQRLGHELLKYGNVSHIFTRLVLVEPQAVLAFCLLLLVLFALELNHYEIDGYPLALCFGATLGIIFGTDALWGLIAMVWFGIVLLARLLTAPSQRGRRFGFLATAVASCGLVCFSFFALGMYQFSSGHELSFSPYWWLFKFAPLYFPVEFGPLLLLGVWGFMLQWRRHRLGISNPLVIFLVIALFQVAFVQVSVLPRERMADRILPIALLVWVGCLFRDLYEDASHRGRLYLAWGLVLIAIPTFFTDIYFTSNVTDVNETRFVSVSDRKACDWIRRNLPNTAVIQGEPQYLGYIGGYNVRQELFISLIASFAERPQVLGWNYASEQVPNGEKIVEQRARDLREMLSSNDRITLVNVIQKYGINYLYVGPYEQMLHPALLSTLERTPQDFQEIYSADGVHIFHVLCETLKGFLELPLGPHDGRPGASTGFCINNVMKFGRSDWRVQPRSLSREVRVPRWLVSCHSCLGRFLPPLLANSTSIIRLPLRSVFSTSLGQWRQPPRRSHTI